MKAALSRREYSPSGSSSKIRGAAIAVTRAACHRRRRKRPFARSVRPGRKLYLGELDPVRPRTLLACLDFKADVLATGERVEVHARVKTGSVEEILFSVLSRDESEPAVLDQLFDSPCRHRKSPLLESWVANARVLSRRSDRGAHRPTT